MLMHQSSIAKLELRGEGRRPLRLAEAVLLSEVLRVPLWTSFADIGFDESVRAGALELRLEDIQRKREQLDDEQRAIEAELARIAVRDQMLGNPYGMEEPLFLVYDLAHQTGLDPDRLLADIDALDHEHLALGESSVGDAAGWYARFLDLARQAGYPDDLEQRFEGTARRYGWRYVFPLTNPNRIMERRVPRATFRGEVTGPRGEVEDVRLKEEARRGYERLVEMGMVEPGNEAGTTPAHGPETELNRGDD